jgi:hypothetical protein
MPKKHVSKHGTYTEYARYDCRCELCKEAARRHTREYKQRPLKEKNLTHGLVSTYNNGCRCELCQKANRDKARGG